jgi:hypothetical protein
VAQPRSRSIYADENSGVLAKRSKDADQIAEENTHQKDDGDGLRNSSSNCRCRSSRLSPLLLFCAD